MEADLEAKLYSALYSNRDEEVIKLCSLTSEGPLHVFTIHNDTVLQTAAYIKKYQLAIELLDHLPEHLLSRLSHANDWGNTILHNASTSNKGIGFARKLLKKAPQLIQSRNNEGETPIFQATRYGRRKMFEFLTGEIDKFCESNQGFDKCHFFIRDDKTTILHMAILTGVNDLALMIASKYPDLCSVRAEDRLTALQIIASNPTAFRSGTKQGFLKELIYSGISTDEPRTPGGETGQSVSILHKAISFISGIGKSWCIVPAIEAVREVKRGHEDGLKLARILVQKDTSWKNTYKPGAEFKPVISDIGDKSQQKGVKGEILQAQMVESSDEQEDNDTQSCKTTSYRSSISTTEETPLLLAAKKGCIEIVQEMLDVHPQAVEHLNSEGQTLLHVAIKNRHLNVFQLVERRNLHFRGLIRAVDKRGNSILHMIGSKKDALVDAKMRSPVLQLSEDLLLLEYMKNICPSCLVNHHNGEMKTADELFAVNNEKLRNEAKEWLKRTAEHCTVVIVLIATVAFAAAYTIPGGPNQQTGVPLLLGQPFFLVFTMTDVLSLAFALTAVVMFLAILTSPYQLKDFRRSLPQKLLLGFTLLFLSVSMMMVSFAATIILMIHNRERWTKIAIYSVAFFPVSIFVLSYIPLYIQLADTFKYWVKKIAKSLPRIACASRLARIVSYSRVRFLSTSNSASSSMPRAADLP